MTEQRYVILIEAHETGCSAYASDLPGQDWESEDAMRASEQAATPVREEAADAVAARSPLDSQALRYAGS